jgi:hypothetical protein
MHALDQILKALPQELRPVFLAMDPAERDMLLSSTLAERELYASLPPKAQTAYAKQPGARRREQAEDARKAARFSRAKRVEHDWAVPHFRRFAWCAQLFRAGGVIRP